MIVIPALTASVSAQMSGEKKETKQVVKKNTKSKTKASTNEPLTSADESSYNLLKKNEKCAEIHTKIKGDCGFYNDINKHCTVGYGHLVDRKSIPRNALSCEAIDRLDEGSPIKQAKNSLAWVKTKDDALKLLKKDVTNEYQKYIHSNVHVPLNQELFNSLLDYTFWRGPDNLKKLIDSSKLNDGNYADFLEKFREEAVKNKESYVIKRRAAEVALFEKGLKKLETDKSAQTSEKSKEVLKDAISDQKDKTNDNKKNTVKSDPNNKSTQDNKKALEQLRVKTTSISKYPKDSIINNFLAEADSFLKQGKYQDAIFYYEQVIQSDPKNSSILNNLAMAYHNLGDYEKALGYYNAIESNPNNKTVQDDKEAIQAKTTSPTNEQKNKEIKDLHDKAWALRDKGKYQEAIKIYEQILDIDHKNFSALWRLGACYLALGDYENAREYYDDALDIDHKDTYVLTMLGYIYEKLGNYDKAMKYYNTSIVIDPNYKPAQDLKKALQEKIKTPKTSTTESPQIHVRSGTCTVNQDCKILIATATGGSPPYTFQSDTFGNGAPPIGMIVDFNGYLTGTPTREGTYNVGVCVVDLVAKSSCDQVTVTVNPVDDIIIEPDITAPGNSARDLTGDWEGTLWVHETYSGDISIDCQYTYQLTLHLTQYPDGTQVGWYTTGTGTGTGHNGKYDCSPSEERSTINFTIFGSEYSGTMGGGPVKGSFTTDQINGDATPDGGDAIITFKFSATRQ